MNTNALYIVTGVVLGLIAILVLFVVFKRRKVKKLKDSLAEIERQRNLIVSTPILSELAKIDVILKNDKLAIKKNEWDKRYKYIKEDRFKAITDMIVEAENLIESKRYKEAKTYILNLEMEIYKLRVSTDNLLDEIREITMSEERNRSIITKLKYKYRELERKLTTNKEAYKEAYKYIELQLENIEKKFLDFEEIMENNEYTEVSNLVKVIDDMIAHIATIIEELPDLLLLTDKIIPERIKEVNDVYLKMIEKGYPLGFLKLEYNITQIENKIKEILDRVRILNIEDSMFELKTFLDYLDNVLNDLDLEKASKRKFDELAKEFKEKIIKVNKIVTDIYNQLEDIKNMYDLQEEDLDELEDVNKRVYETNKEYNSIMVALKEKKEPYSVLKEKLTKLSNRFEYIEEDLSTSLKSLGSMHDDEVRAREQLDEISKLLKNCRSKIRTYTLPIISSNYYTELSEANDAIYEIVKELEKTPITIKTLNIRVDTARDLALKLYNTTNEMIKTAKLSEMTIVYGNRYKPLDVDIEKGLDEASRLFFKGNYKKALETAITSIKIVEPDIYKKMLSLYKNEK